MSLSKLEKGIQSKKLRERSNNIYITKEWKKKKAAYLKRHPKCEWCGSVEILSIHHTYELRNQIRAVRNAIEGQVIEQMIKDKVFCGTIKVTPEFLDKKGYTCECGHQNRIQDTWKKSRCRQCGRENIISEMIVGPLRNYYLGPQRFKEFLKENKEEIAKRVAYRNLPKEPNYLEFNEQTVLVLCKRCHYAYENGLDKCPTCDGYKKREYETCKKCKDKEKARYEEFAREAGFDLEDPYLYGNIMRNIIPTANEVLLTKIFREFADREQFRKEVSEWNDMEIQISEFKISPEEAVELKRRLAHKVIEYFWYLTGMDHPEY